MFSSRSCFNSNYQIWPREIHLSIPWCSYIFRGNISSSKKKWRGIQSGHTTIPKPELCGHFGDTSLTKTHLGEFPTTGLSGWNLPRPNRIFQNWKIGIVLFKNHWLKRCYFLVRNYNTRNIKKTTCHICQTSPTPIFPDPKPPPSTQRMMFCRISARLTWRDSSIFGCTDFQATGKPTTHPCQPMIHSWAFNHASWARHCSFKSFNFD